MDERAPPAVLERQLSQETLGPDSPEPEPEPEDADVKNRDLFVMVRRWRVACWCVGDVSCVCDMLRVWVGGSFVHVWATHSEALHPITLHVERAVEMTLAAAAQTVCAIIKSLGERKRIDPRVCSAPFYPGRPRPAPPRRAA